MHTAIVRNIKNETMGILKLRYRDFFQERSSEESSDLRIIQTFTYRINEREKREKFDKKKSCFNSLQLWRSAMQLIHKGTRAQGHKTPVKPRKEKKEDEALRNPISLFLLEVKEELLFKKDSSF